ncbi:MAG: hypothetical protein CMA31_05600 [Euryarchaeota archaeon]|nr:hypothetical protein [Euryarchaeota archaeon]
MPPAIFMGTDKFTLDASDIHPLKSPMDFRDIGDISLMRMNLQDDESINESELLADGIIEFEWGLRGIDCPDCAMKATTVLRRMPGVTEARVSATEGRVRLAMDISVGRTSKACTVLSGLGHTPDIEWEEVIGVTPSIVAATLGIDKHQLRNRILEVPGILDVRFEDAIIEIIRVPINDLKIRNYAGYRLNKILGGRMRTRPSTTIRLRDDQKQLIAAIMTIPSLLAVMFLSTSEIPSIIPASLTILTVMLAGQPMFKTAVSSLFNMVLGFQFLTSMAVIGALLLTEWEEAIIVTGLVALAAYIEERTLFEARKAMQGGLDSLPKSARVITESEGHSHPADKGGHGGDKTPIEDVVPGDIVQVRSGEIIPVDGMVIEGNGLVNRSPLTGEPIPVSIAEGGYVEAGLNLVRGPISIRTVQVGSKTRLYSLIEMVRKYRETPTSTQSIIERFTAVWVPLVLAFSLAYGLYSGDMIATLILWVVSCPCALLLAAPVPHATALSAASAAGVVARGGDVIENIASANLAFLDKTGTLTSGQPTLEQIHTIRGIDQEFALSVAAALEMKSNHPYADAVISEAEKRMIEPSKIVSISDGEAGVRGIMDGSNVAFGSSSWIKSSGFKINQRLEKTQKNTSLEGLSSSLLAFEGRTIALFTFRNDDLRAGADTLVSSLMANGVEVQILSGDQQLAVERFGQSLGIPSSRCRGDVDPEGKALFVEQMTAARSTLMAGDGFNDSGALATATVGIAMGSGDQINLDAADVLIPGQDPMVIAKLVDISKRTRKRVSYNIAISLGVTLLLVMTTLLGLNSSIALGIALHEASVFIVILNGMLVKDSGDSPYIVIRTVAGHLFRDSKEAFTTAIGSRMTPATTS